MVYLILLLTAGAAFAMGYFVRAKSAPVLDIKQAVASLAQLRDDGRVSAEAANKLILLAREERRKARKHGTP